MLDGTLHGKRRSRHVPGRKACTQGHFYKRGQQLDCDTLGTSATLELFERPANCTNNWELRLLNAVILAPLVHGFESHTIHGHAAEQNQHHPNQQLQEDFQSSCRLNRQKYSNHVLFRVCNEVVGFKFDQPYGVIPGNEAAQTRR